MNASERFTLTMSRFIRAPREKVFDAFTTDTGLAAWMGPRGMQVRSSSADPRVGGAWRVELSNRDGNTLVVGGHYKQLQRPASIVYSWQWEGPNNPMPGVETLIVSGRPAVDARRRRAHDQLPERAARPGRHPPAPEFHQHAAAVIRGI